MRSDPNGYDWRALGYSSLEAFIESKAGACPEWPLPADAPTTPPDDEDLEAPDE